MAEQKNNSVTAVTLISVTAEAAHYCSVATLVFWLKFWSKMQRDLDNNFKYFLNAARELSALIQLNVFFSHQQEKELNFVTCC